MYIRELEENHLEEVAKLEEKTYPKELTLGYEDYKEDFSNNMNVIALGVFSKGELKGYIIALRNDGDEHKSRYGVKSYYISDLVCSNKVHLKMLLWAFFRKIHSHRARDLKLNFECREISHKMMQKLAKIYPFITVDSCELVPNYYDDEDMWKYTITLDEYNDEKLAKTPKELIKYLIYIENYESVSGIVGELLNRRFSKIMGNGFIEALSNVTKNKQYILSHLNKYNVDKWATVGLAGDNIKMIATHKKPYSSSKSTDNEVERLITSGYEEVENCYVNYSYEDSKEKIFYKFHYNAILTMKKRENILLYSDSLSSYRRFFMREIRFLSQNRGFNELNIYDKYGYLFKSIYSGAKHIDIVPYNFSNIFDSTINKAIFLYIAVNSLNEHIPEDTIINIGLLLTSESLLLMPTHLPSAINLCLSCALKIRKLVGEKTALYFIKKMSECEKGSMWIHDWSFTYREILGHENVKYLTRGACKYLVEDCSFNMLVKINNALKSYTGIIKENKTILRLNKEYMHSARKGLSSKIRRGLCDDAINFLYNEQSKLNSIIVNNMGFKSQRLQAKAISFIEDMRRYNENIHFANLVSHFGKTNFKNMVEGKIKCIFNTESIKFEGNYGNFGTWLKYYLSSQGRNKAAKKIFNSIRKIADIESIYKGNISSEKYDEIIGNLKSRGVLIPKQFLISNEFELRIEKKCSPNFLIAGDASVCCMSFGNDNSKTYALEEGFGIINAYYKGRVIANSVIWINDERNCLVLDNIEVAPNYTKEEIIVNLKELFVRMTSNLIVKHNLGYAVQGCNYNDLKLYNDDSERLHIEDIKARAVSLDYFYTDATYACKINIVNDNKLLAC